jgi:hypothetical protein
MIRLYIIGIAILIIAILANGIVLKIGIKSWYDFIGLLNKEASTVFSQLSILDYLWLFIGYPLILGCGYWIGDSIHKLIKTN